MGLVLAAFLLLDCSAMRISREEAARFLWEDLDRQRQSGNLRQLLLRLRNLQTPHGIRLFVIYADDIALNLDGIDIDVVAFRASLPARSDQGVAAVCAAYAGELLAGVRESGAKLSQWLASQRAMLRAEFVAAILPYVEDARGAGSALKVVAAKRLVEADPCAEAGYRVLMQVHAERGDVAGARRLYGKLERLLAGELSSKPSQSARAFYETLSGGMRLSGSAPSQPLAREAAEKAPPARPSVSTALGGLPRLAVLAPAGAGASAVAQELVDYLVNDLATRLSQTRSFVVILPESGWAGGRSAAPSDVDYLVEVRARQGAARPSLYVRLLAVSTREILCVGNFEADEIFAESLSTTIHSIIDHIENREIEFLSLSPEARSAYRLSVQGQRLLQSVDLPSIRRARALFKASLSAASSYGPALAGLSRSYVFEWLARAPFDRSLLETAEQYARKAISVCPDDHRGHRELGLVKLYLKQLDQSIQYLSRAKTLNPDDMDVHVDLTDALVCDGRAKEAIKFYAELKSLQRRDDDYDHWILAGAYFTAGDCRAALDEIERMENPVPAFRISAAAHAILGEQKIARRIVATSMEFNPEFSLNLWLSMFPCRNHESIQRYSDGLRLAGFK